MDVDASCGLLRAVADLEDPRMDRTKRHSLTDILAIAIYAVICGATPIAVFVFAIPHAPFVRRSSDDPPGGLPTRPGRAASADPREVGRHRIEFALT